MSGFHFHFTLSFPGGASGKESANAGDASSIPGSGRSLGVENGTPLAWKIPWAEKSGGLQSLGPQIVGHDQATANTHTHRIDIRKYHR